VQFMVMRMLNLGEVPKPDDVTDALAIGICHALCARPNIG
jgi:Holliday junction resolvasome RuvABC endonuclease subunit